MEFICLKERNGFQMIPLLWVSCLAEKEIDANHWCQVKFWQILELYLASKMPLWSKRHHLVQSLGLADVLPKFCCLTEPLCILSETKDGLRSETTRSGSRYALAASHARSCARGCPAASQCPSTHPSPRAQGAGSRQPPKQHLQRQRQQRCPGHPAAEANSCGS